MQSDMPLFVQWELFLRDLFSRTKRFPQCYRHSLTLRVENYALNVMESVVELRFLTGRRRMEHLCRADRQLTLLRVLLRLAHDLGVLDHGSYEHVMRRLDEFGRMIGGLMSYHRGDADPARIPVETARSTGVEQD